MKGGKGAPRTFKGDPLKVTEFLDDLDQVILASGLTTDIEKFQALKRYCSSPVQVCLKQFSLQVQIGIFDRGQATL